MQGHTADELTKRSSFQRGDGVSIALDDAFVVLFEQQRPDESHDGLANWDNADEVVLRLISPLILAPHQMQRVLLVVAGSGGRPTFVSSGRLAAKPILSRKRSASEFLSTRLQKFFKHAQERLRYSHYTTAGDVSKHSCCGLAYYQVGITPQWGKFFQKDARPAHCGAQLAQICRAHLSLDARNAFTFSIASARALWLLATVGECPSGGSLILVRTRSGKLG